METFGKSGCRRIVPGQFVAVDPRGRACMIGAIEKQKFVYVLNRDATANLTISSPLEAHRSRTLAYDIVGVDAGFENPVFAVLEVEYEDDDDEEDEEEDEEEETEKLLTFYELDLGLNHVVRKWSDPIGFNANMLITVPGGNDGPGGVLVCAENLILYKNQKCKDRLALLPRRTEMEDDQPLLIVTWTLVKRKQKSATTPADFFFLLQSELGDVYEVHLEVEDGTVNDITINYFDTLPVCSALCVLRLGFLFAASEFGTHSLYQFQTNTSSDDLSKGVTVVELESGGKLIRFQPRPLKRLVPVDKIENLSPILSMQIDDLCGEDAKQIFAFCGRGRNSALRVMKHGLPITEIATSTLPSIPNGVWTVRRNVNETVDAFIVVSFAQATIVLSVAESAVQEVTDSGFDNNVSTLFVSLLGDDAMLQIHQNGIRHIRNGRKQTWDPPAKILHAAANSRQVVIGLAGGLLYYLELDDSGMLAEVAKQELSLDITCIDVALVPAGRTRATFCTVGTVDSAVRILSLEPDNVLNVLAVQKLPDIASSLSMIYLDDGQSGEGHSFDGQQTLYLNIGLNNGVMLRTVMDPHNGSLSDTRTRYLGVRPVKLFRISLRNQPAVLALSTRPWLGYAFQRRFNMTPLSYQMLDSACSFASAQCPDGVVAVAQNTLRIFTVDKLGDSFHQMSFPLKYTPRRTLVHPDFKTIIVLESDHRSMSDARRAEARRIKAENETENENADANSMEIEKQPPRPDVEGGAEDMAVDDEGEQNGVKIERVEGEEEDEEDNTRPLPAPPGQWASCLQVMDPRMLQEDNPTSHITQHLELEGNEVAVSMCFATFLPRPNQMFLCVGTAVDYQLMPRGSSSGFIRVYRFVDGGRKLELEHATQTDDVPLALANFQGRLLVGVGSCLRVYDMGKRKMLRKSENRNFYHMITNIHVEDSRIVVSDAVESFIYCKYRKDSNTVHIYADDTVPRYLTASCALDFDTMAGADKFGNFFVVTLPEDVSELIEDDPTGVRINWFNHGVLNGAPNKLETLVNFYTGDLITHMTKSVLVAGGDEAVICATISGGLTAFLPITSRSEVDFLTSLEMHLRQESPPLSGRDHIAYRGAYFPVKNVIDGDLCEQFSSLPYAKQREIAEELDNRTPSEVCKKLEDMRNHVL
eukprot:c17356_g1_i1.p1 GENE.c17356_g1_i1~~c17356_g1_i1.p1  ORF type:complete len:1268 (-),score=345.39 c17356_g1_i1:55-3513(-)